MTYQFAIFDFDGTLADSFPFVLSILDGLADRYKVKRMDSTQVDILRQMDPRTLMKMHNVPLWKLPFMARTMQKMMAERVHAIPVFEGIPDALHELHRRGVTLAVASSNAEDNIRRVLGQPVASLFRYYESRVPLFGKAGRLRSLLRRSGFQPHEAICIGDEIRDLEACKKAGIPFGAVSWGYAHPEALIARSPEVLFETPDQLVAKITA